jgi:stage II sporulation protein E
MPVGILRNVRLERAEARMRRGDIIVTASDGVLYADDSWFIKALEEYNDEPPEEFAQKLAKKAKDIRRDGHEDDITVLVARLE